MPQYWAWADCGMTLSWNFTLGRILLLREKLQCSDLFPFIEMFHRFVHSPYNSKKFCVIWVASIRHVELTMKAVSSVYVAKRVPSSLGYGRTAVYRTLPWGTPARMHLMDDLSPLTSTIKVRSKRYDFRRTYWAVGRRVFNLNSKPSCQTLILERSKDVLRYPMCLLWGSMVASTAHITSDNLNLHEEMKMIHQSKGIAETKRITHQDLKNKQGRTL